jgi:hypothetical protein
VGDFANSIQLHDFEPGIEPSGLFWTLPVPGVLVDARPESGRARMTAVHQAVGDYHDFANAISPHPTSVPSHVTYDVRWHGPTAEPVEIRDETFGFAGTFVAADASIRFLARNDRSGVVYLSRPDGQHTVSGGVGRERNGMFL